MIFHITGCSCAGKSYLINKFQENCDKWDVLEDYYIPYHILKDNEFNFDYNKELLSKLIKSFVYFNKNKYLFIESSGINETINLTLESLIPDFFYTIISLEIPSRKVLIERANKRDTNVDYVLSFANLVRKRRQDIEVYSCEEAEKIIKGYMEY